MDSGDPTAEDAADGAEAVERLEDGALRSLSSAKVPGDDRPL
jgi:hypothetical protein